MDKPVTIHVKRLSHAEETMALWLTCAKYKWKREFVFHPTRKWRVDFLISKPLGLEHGVHRCRDRASMETLENEGAPRKPLLLEIEGVTKYGSLGRHQRADGYEKDCEKYAEALLLGFSLLRVTQHMVKSGKAMDYVERYFG